MGELITATSVLNPGERTTFEVTKTTALTIGRGTIKHHLEVAPIDADRTSPPTSLIERNFDAEYIDAWLAFHEAGLAVTPSLQLSSRNTLLVTDLKADGSEIYGKGLKQILFDQSWPIDDDPPAQRQRPRPETDKKFLGLFKWYHFRKIEREAFRFAEEAAERGIEIPLDDPFELYVRPDGSWNFIALDLHGGGATGRDKNELSALHYARAHMVVNNLYHIHQLLQQVVTPPAA